METLTTCAMTTYLPCEQLASGVR